MMATVPASYRDPEYWFMDTDPQDSSDFWSFKFFLSLHAEFRAHFLSEDLYFPQRKIPWLGLYPVLQCLEFIALSPVNTLRVRGKHSALSLLVLCCWSIRQGPKVEDRFSLGGGETAEL